MKYNVIQRNTTQHYKLIVCERERERERIEREEWHRCKASDFGVREPGFESCVALLKPWASFFSFYIALVHSAI